MKIPRSCGVLMHITSLPGKYGVGTLGIEAYQFADLLADGGQRYWQILPVGPVSDSTAFSPYASPSTFAGNILFISIDKLAEESWFSNSVLERSPFDMTKTVCDYAAAFEYAMNHFRIAFSLFTDRASIDEKQAYAAFCADSAWWLDDYALFTACAEHFKTCDWREWPKKLSRRDADALDEWRQTLGSHIRFHQFLQYIFFKQWNEWKTYCNSKQIKIIGDIPIYVSFDSADVWANQTLFNIDYTTLHPESVSGVPPDYFSPTGQRWGNPLYDWFDDMGELRPEVCGWWVNRIKQINSLVDIIRIDHFRAFESYWAVPEAEETAENGEWRKGPGKMFFEYIAKYLGELPFIAEDLGIITPAVSQLRDCLRLPGMKILQFAFDFNNKNDYLPHSLMRNCIVYTGTHDNSTVNGWFYEEIDDGRREYVLKYLGISAADEFHWRLIRCAYGTVADLVIVPTQDILGYGKQFRMNVPGTIEGNWLWKLAPGALTQQQMYRLHEMAYMYNRVPENEAHDTLPPEEKALYE